MHEELYELKEKLVRELGNYAGKELSGSSLSTIDTLAHAAKNLCKILESADGYSEGDSYRGSSYRGSYRRDSRGRYSSRYYGAADEMSETLDELMHKTHDERIKSEIQRLKEKVEEMR